MDFQPFPKIPRLMRDIVVTEKLDGTNAQVEVLDLLAGDGSFMSVATSTDGCYALRAGSRTRWITPENDNYGFAEWVTRNAEELFKLGPGRHFGEWWGNGIQRNYSQTQKRFSLFNTSRWSEARPACCDVVPVLYTGEFDTNRIKGVIHNLAKNGSFAAPGFMKPEGIVVYHTAGNVMFKRTIEKDDAPKGKRNG